jgi:hypothetical protein
LWRVLAGAHRNDAINGLWTWNPGVRSPGTNNGDKAPFVIGANSVFDPAGVLRNWVQNLNADLLDGRHVLEWADAVPTQLMIPVYGPAGRLAVGDPVTDWDAVNKKTLLASSQGLISLAPCRAATSTRFAGTRATNVITASSPGAFVPDGVAVIVGNRVLFKDQQTGGTGVDNGPYTVTTVGDGVTNAVVTRATDADVTGELVVGTLVFIEEGTVNRATQWSCQRPAGTGGGSIIAINTDVQLWQKTFQQSAYTAGRGLVLAGLEFQFSQNADYTTGSIFAASAARIVTPVLPPSATRWLSHPGTTDTAPAWAQIATTDISNWPNHPARDAAHGSPPRPFQRHGHLEDRGFQHRRRLRGSLLQREHGRGRERGGPGQCRSPVRESVDRRASTQTHFPRRRGRSPAIPAGHPNGGHRSQRGPQESRPLDLRAGQVLARDQ